MAVLFKFELAGIEGGIRPDEGVFLAHDDFLRDRFAVVFGESRLVIEQVELARSASHEDVYYALGFRFEMWRSSRQRVGNFGFRRAKCILGVQQRCQGYRAQANATLLEKPPPRDEAGVFFSKFGRVIHNRKFETRKSKPDFPSSSAQK